MAEQKEAAILRLIVREEDLLLRLLRAGRRLLYQYPRAARTLLPALVAEGRRFARTEEGQQWQETLGDTTLVKHGRLIWQAYGLDAFLETEAGVLPSDWLVLVADALEDADLETILSQLMVEGGLDGSFIDTP